MGDCIIMLLEIHSMYNNNPKLLSKQQRTEPSLKV